ncbi:unnamed protein product [Orchesella dallaii]|uniref:Uncharacterized protein n=1 Tax=Orchesella dallaii TaxID=48710 RepID=A0ABP1RS29_9HEXA
MEARTPKTRGMLIGDILRGPWTVAMASGQPFIMDYNVGDSSYVFSFTSWVTLILNHLDYNTECKLNCKIPCLDDTRFAVKQFGNREVCWSCLSSFVQLLGEISECRNFVEKQGFEAVQNLYIEIRAEYEQHYKGKKPDLLDKLFYSTFLPQVNLIFHQNQVPVTGQINAQFRNLFVLMYHLWNNDVVSLTALSDIVNLWESLCERVGEYHPDDDSFDDEFYSFCFSLCTSFFRRNVFKMTEEFGEHFAQLHSLFVRNRTWCQFQHEDCLTLTRTELE